MAGRSIACRPTMPILPAQFGASGSTFTSATFLFVSITNVARCAAGILASNFVAFLTWPTVLDAFGLFRSAGERHTVLVLFQESGEQLVPIFRHSELWLKRFGHLQRDTLPLA